MYCQMHYMFHEPSHKSRLRFCALRMHSALLLQYSGRMLLQFVLASRSVLQVRLILKTCKLYICLHAQHAVSITAAMCDVNLQRILLAVPALFSCMRFNAASTSARANAC